MRDEVLNRTIRDKFPFLSLLRTLSLAAEQAFITKRYS